MTPPAKRNDESRKAARDAYTHEQYEAAKESQRREDAARREQEKDGKK